MLLTCTNALRFIVNISEALLVNFGNASSIAIHPQVLGQQERAGPEDGESHPLHCSSDQPGKLPHHRPLVCCPAGANRDGLWAGWDGHAGPHQPCLRHSPRLLHDQWSMTILLLCKMFGVPTSRLTSILAVDWLIHQVDSVCKSLTDSTTVAVVARLSQGNSASTQTFYNEETPLTFSFFYDFWLWFQIKKIAVSYFFKSLTQKPVWPEASANTNTVFAYRLYCICLCRLNKIYFITSLTQKKPLHIFKHWVKQWSFHSRRQFFFSPFQTPGCRCLCVYILNTRILTENM